MFHLKLSDSSRLSNSRSHHRIWHRFTFSTRSIALVIGLAAICLGAFTWSLGHITTVAAAPSSPNDSFAFVVDTLADGSDLTHHDGVCAMLDGKCSLRAAFEEIYSWPATSTIATVSFGVTGTVIGAMGDVYADVTVNGPSGGITLTGDTDGDGIPNISTLLGVQPSGVVHISNLTVVKAPLAFWNNGALYVNNVTFISNTHRGDWASAGALDNDNGLAVVNGSTFIGNGDSIGTAGAIHNGNGTLYLSDSSLIGNSANYGGALYNYRGDVIISNVTFSGNHAGQDGGAIYNQNGIITVTNSTLSSNTADDQGGAVFKEGGVLDFTHVTFSGNSATTTGGGIYIYGGSPFTLTNSIVANSTGGDCGENFGGMLVDGGGNLIEDGSCGFAAGGDPVLGPLQDNGGSTKTRALGVDSPAIDAGDPANCLAVDQRGQTRSDLNCDSGAYELPFSESSTITKTNVVTGTYTFGPTLVKLKITTLGTLSDLSVQRIDADHPQRAGASSAVGAGWGRYWTFTPNRGASGFAVDMILPTSFTPDANDKVCRYTGVDRVWDCGVTGFDSTGNWITRTGVTHFSDWAVGNNIGATTSGPRYVSGAGGSDATDCATPSAPCATIGYALTQTVAGDEILVAEGIYTETLTIGSPQTVTLRGGYEATGWTRDIASHPTIVNGNGANASVIHIPSGNVTIEGFTVRGGAPTTDDGGGFFIDNATVVISATTIRDNTTAWHGGGISIQGSNPTVTLINSALISNTAARSGGGLRNWFSNNTVLDNVLVQGNVAQGTGGTDGGGGVWANAIVISNSQILSNTSIDEGGGVFGNRVAVFNSIISSNTVSRTTNVNGGGLAVRSGSLDLRQSLVSHNQAIASGPSGGSGLAATNASVTIDRSAITGNQSANSAVAVYSSPFTFTNVLIVGNAGTGIQSDEAPLTGTLMNTTIANNTGQGMNVACGNVHVTNTIVWGNGSSDLNCHIVSNLTLAYSDVGTGITSGTGNLSIDPKFIGAGNYHLKVGSPVIDEGTVTGAPLADLEGTLRDARPDMGAYEWVGFRVFLPLALKNH